MIILLGSTRAAKVEGAREALAAIATVDERFASAEVRLFDMGAAGPAMPMTEAAIVEGARLRAAALVIEARGTGPFLAVGLEGGLDPLRVAGETHWMLRTWACVTDGTRWSYGAGGVAPVPRSLADGIREGRELGDLVDALAGPGTRSGRGAWGVLTRDLISRRDAFRIAVLAALAPFYHAPAYGEAPDTVAKAG
jgi:non-canonical (house-cleaning) NTP pyrophosphatase